MKTWTLVWFLVFPPEGPNKDVTWESGREINMTYSACVAEVAEKEAKYYGYMSDKSVVGYEVYCREQK